MTKTAAAHVTTQNETLTRVLLVLVDLCSSYRLETPSTLLCGGSNSAYWSQTTTCKYIRSNFNSCIQQASPITCGAFLLWVLLTKHSADCLPIDLA